MLGAMTTPRRSWTTIRSELRALRAIAQRDGARAAIRLRLAHHAGTLALTTEIASARMEIDALRKHLDAAHQQLSDQGEAHAAALQAAAAEGRLLARIDATERVLAVATEGADTLVTVVLPTFDRPDFLIRAIASVLAQRHESWELLVIDNGANPATARVVSDAQDQRVRLLTRDQPGQSGARNLGLREARGELIAYLDDDNVMDPGWLRAVAVTAARRPDAAWFYGARVDDRPPLAARTVLDPVDAEVLRSHNVVDTGVLAHRRAAPVTWSEDPRSFPDWEIAAGLVAAGLVPAEIAARALIYTTSAPGRMCDGSDFDERAAYTRMRAGELLDNHALHEHTPTEAL